MRKLITLYSLYFIASLGLCALSGCGVKRPLYQAPEQQPNNDVEIHQEQPKEQQEK